MREERGSVHDAPMHKAQRTKVIVERMPYQDRIRANEPRQCTLYGFQW